MKKLIVVALALFSMTVMAQDVLVKSLEVRPGAFVIKTTGDVSENPNLTIKDSAVEVIIPNAHVKTKIEKTTNQINLVATQYDRSSVKVTATLFKSLQGKEGLINITLKDSAIEVSVPKLLPAKVVEKVAANISRSPEAATASVVADTEKQDEAYLVKVENEQAQALVKAENKIAIDEKKEEKKEDKKEDKKAVQVASDRVTVAQSSVQTVTKVPAAGAKSSFSIASYVGKFVAFLSLMILGFYGVLTLMKKGVIKKGSLGFLNSTKLVEVLSTTHVAPKRSLMMVKAHKQVFLISSSETGMQLISEIGDVAGLIKTGELEVTGSNFETNLKDADKIEKEFKLKEVKMEESFDSLDDMLNEAPAAAKSIAKAPVKDEVRLSDQIKTKVKNLKQLQ